MSAAATKKLVAQLVSKLRTASAAYYNGGASLMTDDEYDAAVEKLRGLDPENPFLSEVGAPPPSTDTATRLPYAMPSLDKIKPGEDRLQRFLTATGAAGLVLSEKLDGLSALWLPTSKQLYLRGDGIIGQNISHVVPYIQGLCAVSGGDRGPAAIRGELILLRAAGEPLARAWVNGMIHRKDAVATAVSDLNKIHFVAYEVFSPIPMKREAHFKWLAAAGFELPWWSVTEKGVTTEATLATALQARRDRSPYDTDGIVVAYNDAPKPESTEDKARNPKDAVAFKMALADQSATTTVRAVHWGTSNQGYLIPKLEFDPVVIAAATIQFCTAHNAKTVVAEALGPGARIIVRRSGDVIPKLDRVLAVAPGGAALPPAGSYEWDATKTHIKVVEGAEEDTATRTARLGHFLKILGLPGAGPATAIALVTAGITGPAELWKCSAEKLSSLLGPKTGESLWRNLRKALTDADEKLLMLSSSQMPRGVGDTKLRVLFTVEPDPRKWAGKLLSLSLPGWTEATVSTFIDEFPKYEAWRTTELPFVEYPKVAAAGSGPKTTSEAICSGKLLASVNPEKAVCFTGFRDKELEAAAATKGYAIASAITSKVSALVVPDGPVRESEKVKAAKAKGIPILTRSEFEGQYLA